MSLKVVRTLPVDHWKSFVEQHPQGNVFHTPEMFEVFARAKRHSPELWAAVRADKILALFLPVHISIGKGYISPITGRAVSFGSILAVAGEEGNAALRVLLQEYKRSTGRWSLFTELRNISPLEGLSPILNEQGFKYEEHLNYLIDLNKPATDVFQSIGKRTRRNIRSGLNRGLVTIQEVTKIADLDTCYRLLLQTYRAAHVPLADRSLFEAAFEILRPKRMVRFVLARAGDQPAATSVELVFKGILYGWYGGMDRAFTSFVPNELLMWDILQWGAENGFKQYDFGGAGRPDEKYGVRDFKAKFGGKLVCYGRNVWTPRPIIMSLSKFAYQTVRRFFF